MENELKAIDRKLSLLWTLLCSFVMSQGFSKDDIALLVRESDKISAEKEG